MKSSKERIQELDQELESLVGQFALICILLRERASLHPGHEIPKNYYEESAATFAQPSPELIVLRAASGRGNTDPDIFLTKRPQNDPIWPGQWHFPGTTHRYDDTMEDMMDRLLRDELGGAQLEPRLAFPHVTTCKERERGPCMHLVYVAWATGTLEGGQFFPISRLPKPTIQYQIDMIEKVRDWLRAPIKL